MRLALALPLCLLTAACTTDIVRHDAGGQLGDGGSLIDAGQPGDAGKPGEALFLLEPRSLSFGNVVIGTTRSVTLSVSNPNPFDIDLTLEVGLNSKRCAAGSADPSNFCVRSRDLSIGDDGRFTLPAGESRRLDVDFAPLIPGTRERGSFVLRTCDAAACRVDVRLDGLGVESGFRCEPPHLDFGQVNPGTCVTRAVACENIANAQITVAGWGPSSSPPTSGDFAFERSTIVVLNEGGAFDVDVTYCPTSLGNDEGNLQIETDQAEPNRLFQVGLVGTGGGADIEILPPQCDFGLVSLIAPARCSVLVLNVGFDDLEISDIVADTAGTGAFTAPGAGAAVVPPGGAHSITVEFLPTRVGPVQSTLLIRSNDQDEAETVVALTGEGIDLPTCAFEIAPASLDFGEVLAQGEQTRGFEVRNLGTSDCLFSSPHLEPGSDPEFSIPGGALRRGVIAPGSSVTVPVRFRPASSRPSSGAVEISVSSATSPFNQIPVTGRGVVSGLLISPSALDFGTNGIGCSTRARTVRIYNPSTAAAIIDRIAPAAGSNPAFTINPPAPLPGTPLSIPAGASAEFDVTLAIGPSAVGAQYAGAVEIIGTYGGRPVQDIISLQGSSAAQPVQEDRFVQLGQTKVDVLFVVDFSGGTGGEALSLANNFQSFIAFAQAQALDYQVGVTSTDTDDEGGRLIHADRARGDAFGGPFSNRIITPATQPDPNTVFGVNVQGRFESGGSNFDEAGFYASYQALTPPVSTSHNLGFLRPDARLSVVIVADEPEQTSTTFGAPSNDVDFYVSFLQSLKGPGQVTASAISGDVPNGCSGPTGVASAAPRYLELAQRTGGVFESVCTTDWGQALENISTNAFGFRSSFGLSSPPVITTLEVIIDGVVVPQRRPSGTVNWTYDLASNAVTFSPFAVPEPGAQLILRYTPECL